MAVIDFVTEMHAYASARELSSSDEAWAWIMGAGQHGSDLRQELSQEDLLDPSIIKQKLLKELLPESARYDLRDKMNTHMHDPAISIAVFERRLRQLCTLHGRSTNDQEYVELFIGKLQPRMKAHLREKQLDERRYNDDSLTRERALEIAREYEKKLKSTASYSSSLARVAAVQVSQCDADAHVEASRPLPVTAHKEAAYERPVAHQRDMENIAAAFFRDGSSDAEEVALEEYTDDFGFFGSESALQEEACCAEQDTAYVRAVSIADKGPEKRESYNAEEYKRKVLDYVANHRICSQCGGNHEFSTCHANPKCVNRPQECRFCEQHHMKECVDAKESKERLDSRIFIFARGRLAWAEARGPLPQRQFRAGGSGSRSQNRFNSQGGAGRNFSAQQGNASRRV